MRQVLTATIVTAALSFGMPASAKKAPQKFVSSVSTAVKTPVKIDVVIGEELLHRADNLPKKMSERGFGAGSRRNGFVNNGYYGQRDLNTLAARLENKMAKRLEKGGVSVSEDAPVTLKLVLTDARPTRPTFHQMSKTVGLSYQSFSLGGAAFTGELISADGRSLGDLSYAWYENNIDHSAYGSTWSDSHRAISLFAAKTAKTLTGS